MRICPVCTTAHPATAQRCSHCSSPLELGGVATVVVLNGTSSSGKTTLARAFQLLMAEAGVPYVYMGLDAFFDLVPERYAEDVPALLAVGTGFHRCVAVLADAGSNVVVDTVFLRPEWIEAITEGLRSKRAFLVGVHCGLEELERRERTRGDRRAGQA